VKGASEGVPLPVLTLSHTSPRSCRMCIQVGCERRGWPSKFVAGKLYECDPCAAKPRCIWKGCDTIAPGENQLCVGHEWRRRKDGTIFMYAGEKRSNQEAGVSEGDDKGHQRR
jgi:hypothetical protein